MSKIEDWLYHVLSENYCGNESMPLRNRTLKYFDRDCDHVVSFENDAFELGFGYPDKWHMFMSRKAFHKIIRWYVFNWGYREWFGLRRYIWYKLLHRKVESWKKR